jgi:MshEN domain
MSAAAEEIARDDQSGEALAARWSLQYIKASAVSVDPRALTLLERADCKRLRAIPLATGAGGSLVAVCSPSEERFEAIRELAGEQTQFALVSEGTIDALLGSRMFADSAAKAPGPPAVESEQRLPEQAAGNVEADPGAGPAAPEETGAVEDIAPSAEPAPPADAAPPGPAAGKSAPVAEPTAESASVETIVGAVLNALKHRVGATPETSSGDAAERSAEATPLPDSTAELLAHLDSTIETWTSLRAALASIHAEFEEAKLSLREVKEQLSVAHADNDQYRKRVRMLEGEVAESREAVVQARARLQEAADLLEADPTQLQESPELL